MYANYSTIDKFQGSGGKVSCKLRLNCRLCESSNLEVVLKLKPTPPANSYISADVAESSNQECFPLDVFFCKDCTHLQLLHIVDPEILYRHYVYVSGTSPVMRQHLYLYAQEANSLCKLGKDEFIVEFGSNDGTLLQYFKDLGHRVLGVDPARNLAKAATESGITTLPEYFNEKVAREIALNSGRAKLICANHCCAHIDDFRGIIDGVKALLDKSGVWIFEVGYLLDVYSKGLFDTIYHEHVDFHTVAPLAKCFKSHGLKIINVGRSTIQGGALRCFVGWEETAPTIQGGMEAVQKLIHAEAAAGLNNCETFFNWNRAINQTGSELKALLRGLKENGSTIVGYGAPAKATTLMYHFDLNKEDLEYIIDDNTLKQGLVTPGKHIPIVSGATLHERKPDYILILAWNFADSIIEQNSDLRKTGVRFIVPLPNLRVIK